jgi:L-lactate dehydrogenase complex protein LldG
MSMDHPGDDSRQQILERIRQRVGRTRENAAAAGEAMVSNLAARTQGPRPPVGGDLIQYFRQRSEALASSVDRVPGPAGVPQAVARYLRQQGLPPVAVCAPEVAGLDWFAAGLAVEGRAARESDLVGITGCFCAIAETGTLVLCSSPGAPATVSLLPETHIAIVDAARIVPGMEEAWCKVREELGELPRSVNFISGPSRTGDIEQTIVLGAHGPYRVHVLVVGVPA